MPAPPPRSDDPRLTKRELRQDATTRRIRRAVASRRAFPYLAAVTAALGVGAGALARVLDPDDFQSFGDGVWWAIVTLSTVGYGDIVPHTAWGRVLGAAVMILGVTFLSFLTATVTSVFIAFQQEDEREKLLEAQREQNADLHESLTRIEQRLAEIEARIGREGG